MDLRKGLLTSILGVTVAVVALFGVIAYRIAQDVGTRQELALFQDLLERRVAHLAQQLGADPRPDTLVQALQSQRNDREWIALIEHDRVIHTLEPAQGPLADAGAVPLGALTGAEPTGTFESGGQQYLWARAPIRNSPYALACVHPSTMYAQRALQPLGLRIALTAAIVIWIAVWGGLILASVVGRRLHAQHEAMLYQSLHDKLTDLPNRSALYQQLDRVIAETRRSGRPAALLVMDLDRFKEINDTLGHQVGDQLLLEVARRIRTTLRARDVVARLGGDEFAVLLEGANAEQALLCAQKIRRALQEPFALNDTELDIETSVGAAVCPYHGQSADDLIRHAEIAMYQAKQKHADAQVYDAEADPHSLRRLTLLADLKHAVQHDELILYYQPKIDLVRNRITGVEALLRWNHREHGFVPPDEFIALAEYSGLIKPLTQWVLTAAVQQCRQWHKQGLPLGIAVNLSVRNLQDNTICEQLAELLRTTCLDPRALELEITESAMMADPHGALEALRQLNTLGVHLAIDDFGTGYSSLAYLKKLPVDHLKIDRSFVMDMARDESDAVIVRTTIDLAHNLGRKVIAEGVEDHETWQELKRLGCDCAQGYYFARPMPAEDLAAWLRDSQWGLPQHAPDATALPASLVGPAH